MQKLIDTFHKVPSPANRAKLQAHINRHPMAVCCLSVETIAYLKYNGFAV